MTTHGVPRQRQESNDSMQNPTSGKRQHAHTIKAQRQQQYHRRTELKQQRHTRTRPHWAQDTRHKAQRNKEKQQETTSKICVKEKKEPMKIMQWKMTRRRMTRNDDAKAKEFLEREKEPMKMNAK